MIKIKQRRTEQITGFRRLGRQSGSMFKAAGCCRKIARGARNPARNEQGRDMVRALRKTVMDVHERALEICALQKDHRKQLMSGWIGWLALQKMPANSLGLN